MKFEDPFPMISTHLGHCSFSDFFERQVVKVFDLHDGVALQFEHEPLFELFPEFRK